MRFSSIAEFLDPKNGHKPTPAEKHLISSTQAGEPCFLCDSSVPRSPEVPSDDTRIRSELVRLLILGGTPACGLHESGVTLIGGWIEGTLDLAYCRARGQTVLVFCQIPMEPRFEDAEFQYLSMDSSVLPEGLFARGAKIKSNLLLRGVIASGTIDLGGVEIGGQLSFQGARLEVKRGKALNAPDMKVTQGFVFREVKTLAGQVNLYGAKVRDLVDDPNSWPRRRGRLILDNFTYERIYNRAGFEGRRDWLKAGSDFLGEALPQPYTQLARVLRKMGYAGEARKVLMNGASEQARALREGRRIVPNGDVSVAFLSLEADIFNFANLLRSLVAVQILGFRFTPIRSSFFAALMLIMLADVIAGKAWVEGSFAPNSDVILMSPGWAEVTEDDCFPAVPEDCSQNPAKVWADTFTSSKDTPTQGADWDSFNSMGYAVDLVVPFLDLGQTDAWAPSKDRGRWGWWLWWLRWVLATAGWIVTGIGVAAVTGVMQRNQPD